MKLILSPAKSLEVNCESGEAATTHAVFPEETERLVGKLKKLSARQIKNLMSINNDLAELNYERYQSWADDDSRSKPAGFMFRGSVYQGLDFASLKKKEHERSQDQLRILSGLYGLLKPLDLIQPYRLEMGSKFKVTPKVTNMYKFWGDKIRLQLEKELNEDKHPFLVNAASSEYFKAAQLDKLNHKVITTIFKDKAKDGSYKVNMTYAKLARGYLARYIVQNDVKTEVELKAFDYKGFYFSPNDSTDTEFVYLRDKPDTPGW